MITILWVTNCLLPEATAQINGICEKKETGGWIDALANCLSSNPEVNLSVVAINHSVTSITRIQGARIFHYAIPVGKGDRKYNHDYEMAFRQISAEVKPDVVHIHGTEYPHSLAAINTFGADKSIVTVQGLVSVISSFYLAGITRRQILLNVTFHDIVRGSLFSMQREMKRRGEYERRLIQAVRYIGGRTSWDRDILWSINPNVRYYYCGEILRDEFYFGSWAYDTCQPHSIFLSQAYYPIKGLHKVLEALAIVKRQYPDVQLRVAGPDITFNGGKYLDYLRITSYGRIIKKMIKQQHLMDNVTFVGPLNADDMKREYLRANVFVCPSAIENSPNSLGEAQILGVPCVASFVGGVVDMMRGDEKNLYRFEDAGVLAAKVCQVFEQKGRIDTSTMREIARKRHDVKRVSSELLDVYREILSEAQRRFVIG